MDTTSKAQSLLGSPLGLATTNVIVVSLLLTVASMTLTLAAVGNLSSVGMVRELAGVVVLLDSLREDISPSPAHNEGNSLL